MKVLIASDVFPPYISGISKAAYEVAKAVSKQGNEVLVYTSKQKRSPVKPDDHYLFKVVYTQSFSNPFKKYHDVGMPSYSDTKKIFDSFQPDIIHLQKPLVLEFVSAIYAIRRKIPIVISHHFLPHFMRDYNRRNPFLFFVGTVADLLLWHNIRHLYRFASIITCPSETVKEALIGYGVKNAIIVVSNGIDIEENKPGKSYFLHQLLNLKEEEDRIILYFGRISTDKRLDILIKAWGKITDKKNWHLVLCGDADDTEVYKNQAANLENIHFTGFINESDISGMFNSANVFIMPSPNEAQSIVTLNALAHGLPIIVCDQGSTKELVENGSGWIFKFDDDGKFLKETIEKVLALKDGIFKEASIAARKTAIKHDIRKLGSSYVNIYKDAISKYKK